MSLPCYYRITKHWITSKQVLFTRICLCVSVHVCSCISPFATAHVGSLVIKNLVLRGQGQGQDFSRKAKAKANTGGAKAKTLSSKANAKTFISWRSWPWHQRQRDCMLAGAISFMHKYTQNSQQTTIFSAGSIQGSRQISAVDQSWRRVQYKAWFFSEPVAWHPGAKNLSE